MEIYNHLFNAINDLNIWNIQVDKENFSIILRGTRAQLIYIFKEILDWERDCDYFTQSLDCFNIKIDLQHSVIKFILKEEFYGE